MKRILLRLPDELVGAIDKEAAYNLTTRSDMVRRMLVAYLRPMTAQGMMPQTAEEEGLYVDPDDLIQALRRQKQLAAVRKLLRETKRARQGGRGNKGGYGIA